ncbi:MAG TPA: hypothetical protein VF407_00960 [Polyangiaceae bacterium]
MPPFNARATTIYFVVIALAGTAAKKARATPEDPDAKELYDLATADEGAYRFASALHEYDASLAKDPSSRFALHARARADTLRTHAEGDFAPLTTLERFRRDEGADRDPAKLTALATAASTFPPGLVRIEARVAAADGWLTLGDDTKALPLLEEVARDPAADPVTFHESSRELVDAYLSNHDDIRADAIATLPHEDPGLAKKIALVERRRALREAALAFLAFFAVVAIGSVFRAVSRGRAGAVLLATRRFAPLAFGFALWIGVAGGVLASSYETGRVAPFAWLGALSFVIVLLARALGAAQSSSPFALRASAAALSAGAMIAGALFILCSVDSGTYLAGFGL